MQFTYPFYYEPHVLAIRASEELQQYLKLHHQNLNQYGLGKANEPSYGKMYGVLVVKDREGEIGYLSAYSGEIYERSAHTRFVPPLHDKFAANSYFFKNCEPLNELNRKIESIEKDEEYLRLKEEVDEVSRVNAQKIKDQKARNNERRRIRRAERRKKERTSNHKGLAALLSKHNQESLNDKFLYREYKIYLQQAADQKKEELRPIEEQLEKYKIERKAKSNVLQNWLFEQYDFLNATGEKANVLKIFNQLDIDLPPSGAGDCAMPKLLQYAYKNNLYPLCMAEFWWGRSPSSQVRKQGTYYPSCRSKCEPILGHMLKGLNVAPNPMLTNPAAGKEIEIIYEDEFMLAVNKPFEFLSVPGKNINDSVYSRMKLRYPEATGPLIVHRLDMSTSGIMLIAKTKDAHKNLQQQFIKRSVSKSYVALLDGRVKEERGSIDLPLRVDLDHRPCQLVDHEHGKQAITKYEVIESRGEQTLIRFFPVTGRTHQLRVHAAHPLGLNAPILGDDLYGKKKDRLWLHAFSISLKHPSTDKQMRFRVPHQF